MRLISTILTKFVSKAPHLKCVTTLPCEMHEIILTLCPMSKTSITTAWI